MYIGLVMQLMTVTALCIFGANNVLIKNVATMFNYSLVYEIGDFENAIKSPGITFIQENFEDIV
jgi:hypothetical protein